MNAIATIGSTAVLITALLMAPPCGFADPPPTSHTSAATAASPHADGPRATETDPRTASYIRARITAPADGEGLRANSGDFVVQAHVEPQLRQGHRLRLLLNGTVQGAAQTASAFELTGVERGAHQLQLQIVDEDGGIVFEGNSSTFHLLRHSRLHPRPPNRRSNP